MEKNKAHYDLSLVKALVMKSHMDAFTRTAIRGMDAMGLSEAEGLAVVLDLRPDMLLKSMTTHADHRLWQDVYHAPCPNGKIAYIKVTVQAGATIIQFKEK